MIVILYFRETWQSADSVW